jgi:hypothetical protein
MFFAFLVELVDPSTPFVRAHFRPVGVTKKAVRVSARHEPMAARVYTDPNREREPEQGRRSLDDETPPSQAATSLSPAKFAIVPLVTAFAPLPKIRPRGRVISIDGPPPRA